MLLELVATLADALDPLTLLVLEAGLHHAAERGVEVAVVEEIVGDLTEDVVGAQLEADLRTVPA